MYLNVIIVNKPIIVIAFETSVMVELTHIFDWTPRKRNSRVTFLINSTVFVFKINEFRIW